MNNDTGRRRRQAESVLYTLALAGLVGGTVGFLAMATPRHVVECTHCSLPDMAPPFEDEFVHVVMRAPAPPVSGVADGEDADPEEDDDPTDPVPLDRIVEQPIVVSKKPNPEGSAHGTPKGKPNGTIGGTGDSNCRPGEPGCAVVGSGSRVLDMTPELERAVEPRYPHEARKLGLREESCLVHVDVRPDGRPEHVTVKNCHPAFHKATERAMYGSRWKSFDGPRGTVAGFDIRITFTLSD